MLLRVILAGWCEGRVVRESSGLCSPFAWTVVLFGWVGGCIRGCVVRLVSRRGGVVVSSGGVEGHTVSLAGLFGGVGGRDVRGR